MANMKIRRSFFYNQHSFTLVELLIVIGILAILVAAIVVVLNPAQLLAQARDSKRQQDLTSLNQALSLIEQQSGSSATLPSGFASTTVFTSLPDSTSTVCASWSLPALPAGWSYACTSSTTLNNIDGTGWIPLNFNTLTFGATQLSLLPLDPINTSSTGLYYTYVAGGSFELNGIFESQKYRFSNNPRNLPGILGYGSDLSLSPVFTTNGLIGYWNFDNNVSDQINGTVGTWYGASTEKYVSEKIISAATFNGSNDYIDTNASSLINFDTNDFSISYWMKPKSPVRGGWILGRKSSASNKYGIGWFCGMSSCYCNTNDALPSPPGSSCGARTMDPPYNYDSWTHVVIVRDGADNTIKSWVNGAEFYSGSINNASIDNPGYSLYFAKQSFSGGNYWYGSLDDVRIYNRAISDAEIVALYNATR